MPDASPTAAAARALWTASRPSVGIATGRRAPSATRLNRIPSVAGRLDLLRPHGGVGREAVGDDPSLGPRRHPADPLVVGVEDRDTIGRERLDELALRLLDGLDRPDPREVDRLDGGDDADLRPPDPGEVGDLAADVHAHLEDGRLVVGRRRMTVSGRPISLFWLPSFLRVTRSPARTVAIASFVEVLAMLPGHADDERVEPRAPRRGNRVEAAERVRDLDDR